ncbi:unnamed protein product [Angiostrongylus costaricensis]|uniref:H15 domain-containing protein n=1 Tax=Angiostrongylus costaricensis TaxID=334426 RepID=A0A0R3PDE4_ANGCS|nr:unnamed protein product [Angiostrongylus costaricensis]
MVRQAIAEFHDSFGSSKAAIHRYIVERYPLGKNNNVISSNTRLALRRGVERGPLVQVSGSGVNGSYRLAEEKASIRKGKDNVDSKKAKPAGPEKTVTVSVKSKYREEDQGTRESDVKESQKFCDFRCIF